MKKWNWPLLAVITWLTAFITGVWADFGTDVGIITITNLLTGLTALGFSNLLFKYSQEVNLN
jgi:hypothetical protein